MIVQTSEQRWSGDYWAHRAAVLELSHDPWSPDHPFTGSAETDPGLSPYALILGLIVRASPLGVSQVLSGAALFNLALFLIGLRRFVRRFSTAPTAPFWTLLATLFLWGLSPWRWSGYLSANSIGFGLPYPSMFAVGLLLVALSALIEFCDGGAWRQLALLTALAPLAILSHPFTGAALGLAGLAVVVGRLPSMPAPRTMYLAVGAAAIAAAVLAWPLYSAFDLLAASGQYDHVHAPLYRLVAQRTALAAIAVPVLVARLRANHRDPLVLMVGSATCIFLLGWLTERYSLGRILPLGMLGLHGALGVWLAERAPVLWRQGTDSRRLVSAVSGAVVLMVAVAGCRAGLVRAIPGPLLPSSVASDPRLDANDAGLSFVGKTTSPDDLALVSTLDAAKVTPALGAKVVAPGYIAPFVQDVGRRQADTARFFASVSADERSVLIRRYNVSFVLFDLHFSVPDNALGTVAYRDSRYVLVAVR